MQRYCYVQLETPLSLKVGDIFHDGVPPSFICPELSSFKRVQPNHISISVYSFDVFLSLYKVETHDNFFLSLYIVLSRKRIQHSVEITMLDFSGEIKVRTFHFPNLQYVTLKFD